MHADRFARKVLLGRLSIVLTWVFTPMLRLSQRLSAESQRYRSHARSACHIRATPERETRVLAVAAGETR